MKRSLQFVHIGKCGGSTISKCLSSSKLISSKYDSYYESHVEGVIVDPRCDYLICIRNPISRAFSAFEWRYKLVVGDALEAQVNRFKGEESALRYYKNLKNLAHLLYDSEYILNQNASRDFGLIHHLRESISFYLSPILPILSSKNVLGVICQETLEKDCVEILGVNPSGLNLQMRKNYDKRSQTLVMDDLSNLHLRRYLSDDYRCIFELWSKGIISNSTLKMLVFGA